MSKEIEFRAKDRTTGEWRFGFFYLDIEEGVGMIRSILHAPDTRDEPSCDYQRDFQVDERTVGQYIGLSDFKGNKIYQGDIVSMRGTVKIASIERVNAFWSLVDRNMEELFPLANGEEVRISLMTVIGNIHDNTGLLISLP